MKSKTWLTKEFAALFGLKDYQIKYYCDNLGLLNPARPENEGQSNNRRFFSYEDVVRMEQILIFKRLGVSNDKLKEIFSSENYDVNRVFDYAISCLKRRIHHFQNLILFAETAKVMGMSYFSFASFTESEIDEFSTRLRSSVLYKNLCSKLSEMNKEERKAYNAKLKSLIKEIIASTDIRRKFDEYDVADDSIETARALFEDYFNPSLEFYRFLSLSNEPIYGCDFLFMSFLFIGDGEFSRLVTECGGEGALDHIAAYFMLAWIFTYGSDLIASLGRLSALNSQSCPLHDELLNLIDLLVEQVSPEAKLELVPPEEKLSIISGIAEFLFYPLELFLSDNEEDPEIIPLLLNIDPSLFPSPDIYEVVLTELSKLEAQELER